MSADFRQRLSFDLARGELRDGDTRYQILREDNLMGLFKRLSEPACADTVNAFAASLTEHGTSSAARHLARGGDAGDLLATIAATAAQLGWGVWRYSHAEDGELHLEVSRANAGRPKWRSRFAPRACPPAPIPRNVRPMRSM